MSRGLIYYPIVTVVLRHGVLPCLKFRSRNALGVRVAMHSLRGKQYHRGRVRQRQLRALRTAVCVRVTLRHGGGLHPGGTASWWPDPDSTMGGNLHPSGVGASNGVPAGRRPEHRGTDGFVDVLGDY